MCSIQRLCVYLMGAALLVAAVLAPRAYADLAGAKKALDDAKKNVADKEWDSADQNLKLIDVELDGASDADKKSIQSEVDSLKKQVLQARIDKDKQAFTSQAERMIEQAKNDLVGGDASTVIQDLDSFNYFLNRDDVKVVFTPDEIKAFHDRMSKYTSIAEKKMVDNKITAITKSFDEWEPQYKENLNKLKSSENESQADSAARDISQELQSYTSRIADMPADNDKVKALRARIDKMNAEFTSVNNADTIKRALARMQENWKSYESEWGGWDAEKPEISFEEYRKTSSQTTDAFNMPKTHALIMRASYQLDGYSSDETYKQVRSDPQVKAFVQNLTQMRDTAVEKVNKAANKLVEEAEKAKVDRDMVSGLNHLKEGLRYNLGEKAPQLAALTTRVQKLIDGYEQGVAAAEQGQKDLYDKLVKEAADKWPGIAARFSSAGDIDPASPPSKGTLIKLTHRANRASWEFGHNDYDFVTPVNGVPVAANYDASLKPLIQQIEEKTGKSISDEYYDVIAEMQTTCRVQESQYSQILEKWVPTVIHNDAPLLKIVAIHAGALAAAAGDAPIATAGIAAGGSARAGGWAMRFFVLLVGLVAAAAALLKAGYAPVASFPQAGEMQARLGSDNLAYIGLACAALGVVFLLMGRIIYGLVPNVAIIAAGVFAAIDFLAAKGIVKPQQVVKFKPLGVPIGLACAAAVILSLLLGMIGLHLVII
jgi:hypothetical protein